MATIFVNRNLISRRGNFNCLVCTPVFEVAASVKICENDCPFDGIHVCDYNYTVMVDSCSERIKFEGASPSAYVSQFHFVEAWFLSVFPPKQ